MANPLSASLLLWLDGSRMTWLHPSVSLDIGRRDWASTIKFMFWKLSLLATLVLTGCVSVPRNVASQMNVAAGKYATAKRGMTKDELIASLGAPQKQEGSKTIWEIRYDEKNYDSLTVEFDGGGHAISTAKAHARHSSSFLGDFDRSYSYGQ